MGLRRVIYSATNAFVGMCTVHGAGAYGGVRIVSIPIRNTVYCRGRRAPPSLIRFYVLWDASFLIISIQRRAAREPPEEPAVNVSFLVVFRVISSLDIGRRQNLAISTISNGSNRDSQFVVDSCSLEQVRRLLMAGMYTAEGGASIHCATSLASILTTDSGKTPLP